MTCGELFAGIGGMGLGLERAGFKVRWQVELDPFCRKVLAKHWPDVTRYEDVHDVGAHNLEPVDLVCGGFPCQDVSHAGNGAGIEDGTRSGLWIHMGRIIHELRPRYVLVENVAALLSDGIGRVLSDMAEIGYDAEWQMLPASTFGAPHYRDRAFILAYPCGLRRDAGWTGEPLSRARLDGETRMGWRPEPDVGRMAHGVPQRVDRLRALGNAVVPQVSEWIGRRLMAHHHDSESPRLPAEVQP